MLIALILVFFVLTLLFNRLGSLAPGYSDSEVGQYVFTSKAANIRDNPLNSPVTIPQFVLRKTHPNRIVVLRIITALIGFVAVVGFFWIVRTWHTERIAYISTALFATSSWFLLTARTGNSLILLALVPMIIICYLWLEKTKKIRLAFVVSALTLTMLIYAPAGILVILGVLILRGRTISQKIKGAVPVWLLLMTALLCVLLILPLAIAILHHHRLALSVFGLPQQLPGIRVYLVNVSDTLRAIFVNSNYATEAQLGNLGLLDIFTLTMAIAGVIYYAKRSKLDRSKFMIFSSLVALGLIGLGGPVTITLLLPLLYLLVAAGLAWFLQQWFAVFPRNPLARSLGIALIIIAVGFAAVFNLYRYFVAWPHMPNTKANYTHQL